MKANRFTIPNVIFRNKTLTVRINTLKSRKISETKTNFKMTQKQTKRKKNHSHIQFEKNYISHTQKSYKIRRRKNKQKKHTTSFESNHELK